MLGPGRDGLLQPFEHGRSILRGDLAHDERARLLEAREERPKPLRDDKAIAAWNGLALSALAEAGFRLERWDFLEAAERLAEFLLGRCRTTAAGCSAPSGPVGRRTPAISRTTPTSPTVCWTWHGATGELRWLQEARLALLAVELRGRRARRVLPVPERRREPRRAHEGPRRPSDTVRKNPCSPTSCSG